MSGLISDELINNLRTVAYKQLVTPVDIYRSVRSEGAYGTDETWTLVASTYTWFKPNFAGNIVVQPGGQLGHGSDAEFRFAVGTDIQIGDRLTVNGESGFIIQDIDDGATIQLYLKCSTQRVE